MAIISTHLAACAGALTWGAIEWATRRKPSVLGMISGAVAGLGTITPASGFVAPWHGVIIGVIVALSHGYPIENLSTLLSFLLAVFLWPLVLLGVPLHINLGV